MAMEITPILLAAQSPDGQIRTVAEANLQQYQEQNLPQYLLSLSIELSDDQKPADSRRLAGIILKNSLDAKDSAKKELLAKQWMGLDALIRSQVKELLLRTLGSAVSEARQTSSQVIGKVASIEIPWQQWPELIAKLLSNMTQPNATAPLKQATLEALGYVCEETSPQDLEQDQVNAVLTAVVQGMNQMELSPEVRLASVKALYNALDFAESNFANQMERNYIVKVVCDTAVSKEMEIRKSAFECLVAIASTYYHHLEPYMETLFNLTANAVKGDEEAVALQAIEFWSTICEEELELLEEHEGSEGGDSVLNFHFIEKALSSLVQLLLETLLKQEDDQDQDDDAWTISMAGGCCLALIARTVGDAIVPLVMPFIKDNIAKPDWHCREAATFAFGSILEGPTVEKVVPLVHAGFTFLLTAMKDQNSNVRDTTAWTLGKIFELLHLPESDNPVIKSENLPGIMAVLLESTRDAPHVAEKVCGAIYFLIQGYEDAGPSASLLNPYLGDTMSALLSAADRADTSNSKLRVTAYETLNELVRCSDTEKSNLIGQLLHEIMRRLSLTLELQIHSSGDREKQSDLQALLCGVLQVIIQKLSNSDAKSIITQSADQLMLLLLRVFACHSSTVHEEAMLAIGALVYATGPDFIKYMPEFYKYLEVGLQNSEEYEVCSISVGVVGDICRALDDKVLPFCDGIMSALLKALSNSMLHRSVKPPIFSCLGDIALAVEEHFEKYLPYAMPMLQGAAGLLTCLDVNDEDMVYFGNQLRRGIFEAYSGILQGLKNSKAQLMIPHGSTIVEFTEAVSKDHQTRDEAVTKAAVAAIGDLADVLGSNSRDLFLAHNFYEGLFRECHNSGDADLQKTATWASGMINRAIFP